MSREQQWLEWAAKLDFDTHAAIKIGGNYVAVLRDGAQVYVSGQIPRILDTVVVTGRAGEDVTLGQAQYVDFAVKYANKVAFIDTDFVTTQAFCKKYEGREHPFVQALIDEYRFDLVILLENNTPWVADGLRSLGSDRDRKSFQKLLEQMLRSNNIEYVHVESADYDERFLRCVELVQQLLAADLQRLARPSVLSEIQQED